MPGPLSGNAGETSAQRHKRCSSGPDCTGPGCRAETGKTNGALVQQRIDGARQRAREIARLVRAERGEVGF